MLQKYCPQGINCGFYEIRNEKYDLLVYTGKRPFYIELKNPRFLPKSGLLMIKAIDDHESGFEGKKILDIGTGYTGLFSYFFSSIPSTIVHAVDIDQAAIRFLNEMEAPFEVFFSDMFSHVNASSSYDVIISNPPQLPFGKNQKESVHDYSGNDGKDAIHALIHDGYNYLKDKGVMYLLVFGFLGVDVRTNSREPSIFEEAVKQGFSPRIIEKYVVPCRPGGRLEEMLPVISEIYNEYAFPEINGQLMNEIYIISLEKKE